MHITPQQYAVLNRYLLGIILGLGLYIALAPVFPAVWYSVGHSAFGKSVQEFLGLTKETTVTLVTPRSPMQSDVVTVTTVIPKQNTLSIPKIGVFVPIIEGTTARAMDDGAWRRPHSALPGSIGNVVLVGHRFLYTSGPKTFYHLDKVVAGDKLVVYWQEKEYVYEVESVLVTLPNAVEIEQATEQPMLTVYTCTPLFTVDKRLVVRAKLVQ